TARPALSALMAEQARQRVRRRVAAARAVAELLLDAAALRAASPPDEAALAEHGAALRARGREREDACARQWLSLYGFRQTDVALQSLPAWQERLDTDLFRPEALKQMGIHVGKGLAAGAAAGATVDLIAGGLSLGAGTLVG